MTDAEPVSGVVLAGGRSRRMHGRDKGLEQLAGRPLVTWVIGRFAPQVDELLISANRNLEAYAAFGHPVVADRIGDFAGPLAGLHAALSASRHPLLAAVPCDAPFLPTDLVCRLRSALGQAMADIAVARTPERLQPLFCLCRRSVLPALRDFLNRGGHGVVRWLESQRLVEVIFAEGLDNLNSPDDLAGAEPRLARP